jgi:hypothetical protein
MVGRAPNREQGERASALPPCLDARRVSESTPKRAPDFDQRFEGGDRIDSTLLAELRAQ